MIGSTTPQWPTAGAPTTGEPPSPNLISLTNFYVNLLILQYYSKPKAQAITALFVKQALADDLLSQIQAAYNIDTAVGVQLDVIGKYVGLSRNIGVATAPLTYGFVDASLAGPLNNPNGLTSALNSNNKTVIFYSANFAANSNLALSDESYRFMLKLKIADNINDGTLASIMSLLQTFFGDTVLLVDNQDMTLTYTVAANAPATAALLQAYLPKPMGVGITVLTSGAIFTRVTSDGSTRVITGGGDRIGFID